MNEQHDRVMAGMRRGLDQTQVRERGLPFGTSHPTGMPTGYAQYRTDLGLIEYYDGTRWLSVHDFPLAFGAGSGAYTTTYVATTASARFASTRNDYQLYLIYAVHQITTGGVNSGVAFITYNFVDSSGTTVWTVSTATDAINTTVVKATAAFTQPGGVRTNIRMDVAVTGAPSAQFVYTPVIYAKLIIP